MTVTPPRAMPFDDLVRIASFDGGGVRGLIQVIVAAYIEDMIGAPLLRNFHLTAGTSVGAINAMTFATPMGWERPLYSAQENVIDFKDKFVGAIFQRDGLSRTFNSKAFDLINVPFHNSRKNTALEAIFNRRYQQEEVRNGREADNFWLSKIEDYMLFTSFVPGVNKSFVASTEAAKNGQHGINQNQDFLAHEISNGSSAAPGLFDLPLVRNRAGKEYLFGDGGFIAKNPMGIAFNEATRVWGLSHNFLIVSFGTGTQKEYAPTKELQDLSQLTWAKLAPYAFMDAQSDLAIKQHAWKSNVDIIRFDIDFDTIPKFDRPNYDFVDASPENMEKLEHAAKLLLAREENQIGLEKLAAIFQHTKTPISALAQNRIRNDWVTRGYSHFMNKHFPTKNSDLEI